MGRSGCEWKDAEQMKHRRSRYALSSLNVVKGDRNDMATWNEKHTHDLEGS